MVETPIKGDGFPVGAGADLAETLARAAVAAIADTVPTIEADPKAVRYLTVEIEVAGGKPVDARAWVERGCNLKRLLGVGRG